MDTSPVENASVADGGRGNDITGRLRQARVSVDNGGSVPRTGFVTAAGPGIDRLEEQSDCAH